MAAFIKKTLDKRRNRTSSSDESSTSQEAKKPRSGNTGLSGQTEEDDHDGILAALSMAEGLQETLKEINQKLKKLDDLDKIQTAVNAVQKSLQNLELKITSLETSQATASRDIENLNTSTNDAAKKHLEFTESFENQQEKTKQAFANLQKKNKAF